MMQISNLSSPLFDLSNENIARAMGFKFQNINEIYNDKVGELKASDYLKLDDANRAKVHDRNAYPLTGFTNGKEAKVSIIGKLMGYDNTISKEDIRELKKFIDDSGVLGLEKNPAFEPKVIFKKDTLSSEKLSVDDFIDQFANKNILSFISYGGSKTAELLDSDMSIDEFKGKWAKFALEKRFGVELDEDLAKETMNVVNEIEIQRDKDEIKEKKFKPIQITKKSKTYDIQADEKFKEFYKFIKTEFDNGKNIFEILEKIAKTKVDKIA